MGGSNSSEDDEYYDPRVYEFLGMTFMCDLEHFQQEILEEQEVIYFTPYMWYWVWIQIFLVFGIIIRQSRAVARSLEHEWYARIVVAQADGYRMMADYNIWRILDLQWVVCDPIMFRYFFFHPFWWYIPLFDPWGFFEEAYTLPV